MYAIIETGGKQYKVSEGDVVFIEKVAGNEGDAVKFDKVLAIGGEKTAIGT
ncbi:MAG: 50S ribosomal protein L21, partial [Acutalibacteraceae bacterium]|nr:50S ribosomal protein L21 [Acutalibacteraceae bacterium]